MRTLGICHDVFICSAAIVEDGQILSAIAEERLDRKKQSRVFPVAAIDRCLAESNLTFDDIDEVAVAWNPSIDIETISSGWLDARRHRGEHLVQVPARLMRSAGGSAAHELTISGSWEGAPPITFVDHYASHVGNSYFMSPFDEAALAVIDGRAEKHTSLFGRASGVEVTTLREVRYPHSIGLFYSAVTQFLGFRPDSDEWKVMALASYAAPDNEFLARMSNLVRVGPDGTFELALEHFEFYNQFDRRMFSDKFVEVFGKPRAHGEELRPEHERLAAAAQHVFEQAMAAVLTALHDQTGLDRVALSGGCFMNSVFNGKVHDLTPFTESYISSCPDDSGTSVGAAMYLDALRSGRRTASPPVHNYWGPSYSDADCMAAVRRYGLPNAEVVSDPAPRAAQDLVDGRIVGWFQGAMEFGQRSLGHRSIVLDPRRADGKDVVNAAVKFRESFRPFVPAILSERLLDWFDCPAGTTVPYMERVYPFRTDKLDQVPAVTHVDGTGRLQTVDASGGPERFRSLIEHFERLTGVPIVLNTSFNLNGEPIVCSPEDAIRTFYTCALDVLYLGNVRVAKVDGARVMQRTYRGKRLFDLAVLAVAAIPASIVGALCALAVRMTSRGPVIFRQQRIGMNGTPFMLLKFRTMFDDPDRTSPYPVPESITRVGRFLRRLSLDELPQLINVARGDMSIVGPRPTLVYQVERYDEHQRGRLAVRPGLTGLAQIRGRNELSWPERIVLDLQYVRDQSMLLDARLLLATPLMLLKGSGVEGHPTDDPIAQSTEPSLNLDPPMSTDAGEL